MKVSKEFKVLAAGAIAYIGLTSCIVQPTPRVMVARTDDRRPPGFTSCSNEDTIVVPWSFEGTHGDGCDSQGRYAIIWDFEDSSSEAWVLEQGLGRVVERWTYTP